MSFALPASPPRLPRSGGSDPACALVQGPRPGRGVGRLKGMRFAFGTLLLFLGATPLIPSVRASSQGAPPPTSTLQGAASPSTSVSSAPAPSPSPTPRYKLIPYGFESAKERTMVPLLRFEDKTEIRSLEMNAAIARFFEPGDEKRSLLRGATPGGAPTLRDMAEYRPHVTPALDLMGATIALVKEIRKQVENHKSLPPAETSPTATPTPSPTAAPRPHD